MNWRFQQLVIALLLCVPVLAIVVFTAHTQFLTLPMLELPPRVRAQHIQRDAGLNLSLSEVRKSVHTAGVRISFGKRTWPMRMSILSLGHPQIADFSYADFVRDDAKNEDRAVWKHASFDHKNPALLKDLTESLSKSAYFWSYDHYLGEDKGDSEYTVALELDGKQKKVVFCNFLPKEIGDLFLLVQQDVVEPNNEVIRNAPIVQPKTISNQLKILY